MTMSEPDQARRITANWLQVQEAVEHAVASAGRESGSVRVVGVSKYVPLLQTKMLIDAGSSVKAALKTCGAKPNRIRLRTTFNGISLATCSETRFDDSCAVRSSSNRWTACAFFKRSARNPFTRTR